MPNPQKVQAVDEAKKLFEESTSFFVTDYQGLDVAKMTTLRKNLRENSVTFLVEKNTLLKIASKDAGVPDISEHLSGPTAIAFTSEDPVVAAKVLHESYKEHKLPRTKVFVVDEDKHAGDDLTRLADLPPMDALLGQLAAAIEAPLTELVGTLDGFFRELVGSLEALADKMKNEGGE